MKPIPLFEPKPLFPPSMIPARHWRDEAELTEVVLRRFLGLDDHVGILLMDRATHALELAFDQYDRDETTFLIPRRTYRAAWDAAEYLDREAIDYVQPTPELEELGEVVVPTTLGGTRPCHIKSYLPFVYDCAHTTYPNMFRDVIFTDKQFAVLSFYPTKPLGAYGGGALIGDAEVIKRLRPKAWPIEDRIPCEFTYPQSIQSWGIRQRIAEWDRKGWTRARLLWARVASEICTHYGLEYAWPQPDDAVIETPHLLAFRGPGVELLSRHCESARIECGTHYPPVDGSDGCLHITIPFHTVEVIDRLQRLMQRPAHDCAVRNTCPR